jgi:sigma-B regulation protein RsbU (phosphoserine phosphatase)
VSYNAATKPIARGAAIGVGLTLGLTALWLFVFTGSLGGLGRMLGPATLYMLPALALQAAVALPMRRWMASVRRPMNWIIFVGVQLTAAGATAAVASFLMLVTGVAKSWNELVQANRVVIVSMVLITCAIEVYASTRRNLESRNRQLEERVEAESRALQLHQQDFELAGEIQRALMPTTLPQIQGCELAAGCQPARMVGGDYFDAIRLGDARAAIAIGDVSGKGMAAALLMSNLQAIVRAFAPAGLEPHELCAKANQLIAGNVAPGKYITFFYAVIDTVHMRLDYCNAGHNPPILRHRDGAIEMLREGGPVLGVIPGASYAAGTVELRSGDCLVLYTDGISEAFNANDEEFGEERLILPLKQPGDGAEERRRRIMVAVTEFSNGNFQDDATMMVVSMH